MKTLFLVGVALYAVAGTAAAGTITLGSFVVNPGATFLQQSAMDNCSYITASAQCTGSSFFDPTRINLLGLSQAVNPGDTIQLTVSGLECYIGTTCSAPPNIAGIFSQTSAFDPTNTHPNRVTNAVATPGITNVVTSMYIVGGPSVDNTLSQDFKISGLNGLTVVVPSLAQYLFIGIYDSFYADNTGNVTITLSETTVSASPEPATYVLVLAGLGALAVGRMRATRS